ncbi:MAG: hypothetical protein RSA79_00955 [Oscillospiraceae bacterium]
MEALKDSLVAGITKMLSYLDPMINEISTILGEDFLVQGNAMYDLAQNIAKFITPVALTIIGICFLLEFLKITVKMDILKWEFALKVFILLALSQAVISAAPMLMSAIYGSGIDLINKAIGGAGTTSQIGKEVVNQIVKLTKDMKWGQVLGVFLSTAVPMMAIWACTMIIKVMAYARMFEIIIHVAVAPIPCAFLPLENSQITKKFFMSFAAVSLQGLFMIVCVKLFGVMISKTIATIGSQDIMTMAMQLLICSLVLVMSIVKTGQWSKSILDAN